jgi:uncharacterized membrane protein YdjX (TVP38/TMEM64 family)
MMDEITKVETPPSQGRRHLRLLFFVAIVMALFVGSFFLPTAQWLLAFREWVESQGIWGALVYAGMYVVCTVLFVPGSPLTIGAGYLYGPLWGTIVAWLAATAGASLAFLVGRYVARDQVQTWIKGKPKFAALDGAIARKGGWIVLLLRLSPVFPFNLLNYALGLTGVRFRSYLLASWVGMLPGTIAFVLVGYAGKQSLEGGEKVWYWAIAAAVTLIVTFFITRLATRAIREATQPLG